MHFLCYVIAMLQFNRTAVIKPIKSSTIDALTFVNSADFVQRVTINNTLNSVAVWNCLLLHFQIFSTLTHIALSFISFTFIGFLFFLELCLQLFAFLWRYFSFFDFGRIKLLKMGENISKTFVCLFQRVTLDLPEMDGWQMHVAAEMGYGDRTTIGKAWVPLVLTNTVAETNWWSMDSNGNSTVWGKVWFMPWSQLNKYACSAMISILKGKY